VDEWIRIHRNDLSKLNKRDDDFGYAPIHYAVKFNNYNVLVKLVNAGAGKYCGHLITPHHLEMSCFPVFHAKYGSTLQTQVLRVCGMKRLPAQENQDEKNMLTPVVDTTPL
jgi:ankyrin repeat protein